MLILDKLRAELDKNKNVIFALIFGSFANGKINVKSDLDIAIYYKNPPEGMDKLKVINGLAEIVGRDVDLVVLNHASAFLRHQILKKCIRLLIKDQKQYQIFRVTTMDDYDEYKYISGINEYGRRSTA